LTTTQGRHPRPSTPRADALRRPARFSALLLAAQARWGSASASALLQRARDVAAAVALPPEQRARLQGPEIAHALRAARTAALAALLAPHSA